MILTKRPYGAIQSKLIEYKYVFNDRFYIVDNSLNIMEIEESEFNRLDCPIKEPKKWR